MDNLSPRALPLLARSATEKVDCKSEPLYVLVTIAETLIYRDVLAVSRTQYADKSDLGFVALLGNNQLIAVSRYDEPHPKVLATPPSDTVVSWTLVSPAHTLSRSVEVLLGIGQTINVVDADDSEDRMLQNGE